jgi:hypothetical protein
MPSPSRGAIQASELCEGDGAPEGANRIVRLCEGGAHLAIDALAFRRSIAGFNSPGRAFRRPA